MRRILAISLMVGVYVGCGNGGSDRPIDEGCALGDCDGGHEDPPLSTCNPVAQTGCEVGEKCASVTVQASPLIVQTLCVPDGDTAEGEACTNGEPGPSTGYDDCTAAGECIFGECHSTCRQQGATVAGTCADGDICQIFQGLYEDLDSDDFGVCIPGCDPTQGISRATAHQDPLTVDYSDQCGDTLQCFMNVFDGLGVCAAAFDGSPGPGQECADENGDGMPDCSLNGCAPGSGPWLPGGSLTQWQGESVFFANSIFNLADTCAQVCDTTQGVGENPQCPANNECRYVTGLYLNFDDPPFAPDEFGLCVPAMSWGTCADNKLGDVGAYLIPEGSDPPPNGITNNDFIPGCNTGQEVADEIEACTSDSPPVECAAPQTASAAATSTTLRSRPRAWARGIAPVRAPRSLRRE